MCGLWPGSASRIPLRVVVDATAVEDLRNADVPCIGASTDQFSDSRRIFAVLNCPSLHSGHLAVGVEEVEVVEVGWWCSRPLVHHIVCQVSMTLLALIALWVWALSARSLATTCVMLYRSVGLLFVVCERIERHFVGGWQLIIA